ncbi:MAG: dipeptidyl aminopeptidase/acylaminoacyl-peptidase family protein [Bacteroidetes bacterium HLUCCA01]|nr:MAG: dipeptidyl aminopeptidase/acylaminoacyl-peptidase family protein [Bacteroidetes bacterium HLUCCA01]
MPKLASITSLAIFLIAIMPHEGTSQSTRTGENTAAMSASRGIDTLQLRTIFAEPFLPGTRPTPAAFHPTNDILFFSWNDSSYAQTSEYAVSLGNREIRPRNDEEALVRQSAISPDNRLRVWRDDKDLKLAAIDGANERVLTSLGDYRGNPVWSENSHQVAIISAGNIVSVNLATGETRKITDYSDGEELNIRTWVGDSTVVYTLADRSEHRTIYFPTYTDHFVTPGASQRGVIHLTLRAVNIHSRENRSLAAGRISLRAITGSPSGRYLITDIADEFLKNREIASYDLWNDFSYTVLHSESTDGWIHGNGNNLRFAPAPATSDRRGGAAGQTGRNGTSQPGSAGAAQAGTSASLETATASTTTDLLLFASETDGFNHLYRVYANGSGYQQLTRGEWEVAWNRWIDRNRIVYASTEVDPGERHLYMLDVRSGNATKLTSDTGYRDDFVLSADKRYVAYRKTYFNQPDDIFMMDLNRPRGEVQLTNSVPERFAGLGLAMPEYIRFTGRDGETQLSMELIKPYDFDPSKQYPVVVFMHGAGSLQNVYKGWSASYWREYLFHHFLAREGYVVIEVDFRHSLGYGRKFREDVTNWMGHYELQDVIDGMDLVARDGYIDVNRVGVYGGSYGGFMTLYALSHAPDRFHVGAALRKVTNWENYYWANPWYTGPRLGHPERDSLHYARSSPLTFADSLSRPVLLLHGLIDDNVGFQDAMQYVDRLIKSGNEEFDLMVFPSERHSFTQPAMWYDQYRRIFHYFEEHLKETETPQGD